MKKLKLLLKKWFLYEPLKINIVRFDTQDQTYNEMFTNEWKPNRLFHEKSEYFFGKEKVCIIESSKEINRIELNNFPYNYVINKSPMVNSYLLICEDLEKHWKNTDIIDIIFYHN